MLHIGSLIKTCDKQKKVKKRKWPTFFVILLLNRLSNSTTSLAPDVHMIDATIEDVCAVIAENSFWTTVQKSIESYQKERASIFNDCGKASGNSKDENTNCIGVWDENADKVLPTATSNNSNCVDVFRSADSQYYFCEATTVQNKKQQNTYQDSNIKQPNLSHEA